MKILFDDNDDNQDEDQYQWKENLLDHEEQHQFSSSSSSSADNQKSKEIHQRKHFLAKLIVESQKNLDQNSLKRKNSSLEDLTKIHRKLNSLEEQIQFDLCSFSKIVDQGIFHCSFEQVYRIFYHQLINFVFNHQKKYSLIIEIPMKNINERKSFQSQFFFSSFDFSKSILFFHF